MSKLLGQRIVEKILDSKEIIFLFGLSVFFFYKIFLHFDQIIFPSIDVLQQYSFWRSLFATNILNGEGLPLWNPYVFSGTPFIGNPLSGMFYPFTWIFISFNSDLIFGYLFFIDIFLIGVFTYCFGRTINLDKFAALFSAVSFMFCGAIIPRIFAGHLSNLDAIVWFPLVLMFYERTFKNNRILNSIYSGVALALMFLAGNFQFAIYGAFIAFIYFLFRTLFFNDIPLLNQKIRHIAIVLLVSVFLCGLLSAVQLLPSWEYSQVSNRAGGVSYDFSSEISLPPENLLTIILPDLFGSPSTNSGYLYWELSFYVGILPLILIFIGLLFHRTKYTYLFSFLAIFALLVSLGRFFPVYQIVFYLIPGFSMFRIPSTMLFVFSFSLAILSGFGCEYVIDKNKSVKCSYYSLFRKILFFSTIFSLMVGIFLFLKMSSNIEAGMLFLKMRDIIGLLIFTTFFCISTSAIYYRDAFRSNPKLLKIFLMTIIILDLFLFGVRFIDTRSPGEVNKNPEFLSVFKMENDDYFRIYDQSGFLDQNLAFRNNLFLVNGYDPTYLKDYQQFFLKSQYGDTSATYWWKQGSGIKDLDTLRFLNVRYIITTHPLNLTGIDCIYNYSPLIYRLNFTYPRAYLIPVSEYNFTKPDRIFPVKILHYSPNSLLIHSNNSADTYLVTSEIDYPGWVARENTTIMEIRKYKGIFRSVQLTPGEHSISFTYFPEIFSLT